MGHSVQVSARRSGIVGSRVVRQTDRMSATGWGVVGIVVYVLALWALVALLMFRPRPRRLFHRLYPKRAALDRVALLLWPLLPISIFLGTEYSTTVSTPAGPRFDWWRTIPLALCLIAYLAALSFFTLQARKAKEPTYLQWKNRLPARPDIAS